MGSITKHFVILIISLAATGITGFSLWDPIVDIPGLYFGYNEMCIRTSPGTYQHCYNYNGSVSCMNEEDIGDGIFVGTCLCNLGDDAYFEADESIIDAPRCLGKVGALCTSVRSTLVPDKLCTPNAQCVPDKADYFTGTCQCMDGYKEDAETRRCIPTF